ncbi:metallophosphoesterase [Tropicimonas sp. IMCC34011]|uniref:metallophosphoesterase family protein n=1 Tax=Tropicimonas sp. IMCC34011 TaxID=2248759 RepID=UPI000E2642D4|nr:metallophosphoesterase [Tropicimonas sp. IMCC34011]
MRILAFSDVHRDLEACAGLIRAAEEADLVLGAGDFATSHEGLTEVMDALAPLAAKAVFVPGNNESLSALRDATTATVLHGETCTKSGVTIAGLGGGIPPLPPLPWGSWDLTEEEAETALAGIGSADILVLHSPPKGVADVVDGKGSVGSVALRDAIERIQPRLVVCGHIHDCWGRSGSIGTTSVNNLGPAPTWFEL